MPGFVDIHCHLLPGIDDGASDLKESITMAKMAVEQGVDTIVVTPHQLGAFGFNRGEEIRQRTAELQQSLEQHQVPLRVLPGADVRIEDGMVGRLVEGDVLSLGDYRRHVLLELPHELYFPLEPVLEELRRNGMTGVLSHPERNAGLLKNQGLVEDLVDAGCLMQVTGGSLLGTFGPASQGMAQRMAERGTIHFVATDAHGPKARRPRMRDAYQATVELAGEEAATLWCSTFPRAVAQGMAVPAGRTQVQRRRSSWSLFGRRAA